MPSHTRPGPTMEDAQEVLRQLDESTSLEQAERALCTAADFVSRNRLSSSAYAQLLNVSVNRAAPFLSETGVPAASAASQAFDDIFLRGHAAQSFMALVGGLRTGVAGGDVLARTAMLFAAPDAGGVARLSAVVMAAVHEGFASEVAAAALAHLPARAANAAGGAMMDEHAHAGCLGKALLNLPSVQDSARDSLVASLLGALVKLGAASALAEEWARVGDAQRTARIVLLAPESGIPALLRALLEVSVCRSFARDAVTAVLRDSASARSAAVHNIPARRPLLARPRLAAPRLVKALEASSGSEAVENALFELATVWSSSRFALHTDFRLQRQATRILLLYLRAAAEASMENGSSPAPPQNIMIVLARGVTARLDHGDNRVRRFGMVVGEAFSKHCGDAKPLRFDRASMQNAIQHDAEAEGEGDSDFSDIATCESYAFPDVNGSQSPENSSVVISEPLGMNGTSKKAVNGRDPKKKRPAVSSWEGEETGNLETWELEDDWESLDALSDASSSGGEEEEERLHSKRRDYDALRKAVSAPMSVSRVLKLLRSLTAGDDGPKLESEVVCSTLRTITVRSKKGVTNDALYHAAPELCRAVLLLEPDRFPSDGEAKIAVARKDALVALAVLDIASVGAAFISTAIDPNSDRGRRVEALSLLADAARTIDMALTSSPSSEATPSSTTPALGTTTRRLDRSLAVRNKQDQGRGEKAKSISSRLARSTAALFFQLANGLTATEKYSLVLPSERDAGVFAHGLATLAALLELSGPACMERSQMAHALGEMAARAGTHADPAVRRAAALAAGSAAGATAPSDVLDDASGPALVLRAGADDPGEGAGSLVSWLSSAADNDGDVLVRRFAGLALRKWHHVLSGVANGE